MKNLTVFLSALVALLFSVAETSAQITPPYYNPANVAITGGTINGATVGATTPAAGNFTTLSATSTVVASTGLAWGAGTYQGYLSYSGGNVFIGNLSTGLVNFAVNGVTTASVSSTIFEAVKPFRVSDTTDASSTTTGSLKTAGGLGVAKKSYFGDSMYPGGGTRGVLTWGNATINGGAVFSVYGLATQWLSLGGDGVDGVAIVKSTGVTINDGKTLQVGSGSTTSAGLIAGYLGVNGFGAIWSTAVTPATTNFALNAGATTTSLGSVSGTRLSVGAVTRLDATATSITHFGDMIYDKTITAAGTTGAQTINKTTGRVNFAAAAASLVVTNSLVTANSIVHCTVATNDTTMKSAACVPAAGSFTIYSNAAATAETAVAFTVTN